MASVNTNAAAITALRTLQNTNATLDKTQSRISTGYKIGEAKDNAAYWAISTTLKSDNKSLSTVKDALGLGASTVDTAYQGLNKTKDVLDEIKSKLTAATQDGVNRDTIQNEITQLQDQLKSIATSSVFSGENWLSVDSSAVSYNTNKQVVASFSRDGSGAVNIGTIAVDISKVALFDASTVAGTGGIVDGAVSLKDQSTGRDLDLGTANADGNTNVAGLVASTVTQGKGTAATTGTAVTAAGAGLGTAAGGAAHSTATYNALSVAVTGTVAANDYAMIALSGGGSIKVVFAGGETAITASMIAGGTVSGAGTTTVSGTPNLVVDSGANSSTAAKTLGAITFFDSTNAAKGSLSAPTPGAPTSTTTGSDGLGTKASVMSGLITASEFAIGDKINVSLNINGAPTNVQTAALTATTINDIAAALDAALTGVADVAKDASTNALVFTANAVGAKTSFDLTKLTVVGSDNSGKTIANGIGTEASIGKFEIGSFSNVTLDKDDHLYFKIQVDNATAPKDIVIDQALINKTLSTVATPVTNGGITSAADFKKVLDAALINAGVNTATTNTVTTSVTSTNKITFTSATSGATSMVAISDVKGSAGADKISLDKIDISSAGLTAVGATTSAQIKQVLAAYIDVVNTAINKVTSAAAALGSVASRIDLQKSFVDTLMDTIDKGVGNLIDADMSEESTKLQALQVKQQLGVQALSIANQASQSILSLFRS